MNNYLLTKWRAFLFDLDGWIYHDDILATSSRELIKESAIYQF
ncbi:hypothetical protein V7075_12540 [Neobacillus drentensis]|nr:hypothetical protein [Neobacillus sp. YX16]WHZ03950.1 hypothetical protein QNH48_04615 [Neobacillus sp. YX16]